MYFRPVNPGRQRQSPKTTLPQTAVFPAAVAGWVSNQNLAEPAPSPQGAAVLENIFPTATGGITRRGSAVYAEIGDGVMDVTALFSYKNGSFRKFYGAVRTTVFDITDGADPVPVVTEQSNGDWIATQFATTGGVFLLIVNGQNFQQIYDGSTWSTSHGGGITGVDTRNLDYVWVYKNRLMYVERESMNAWYLPADQIGGTAKKFPLGGEFTEGGKLLFGASWSLDSSGAGGLSEQCVFVSDQGQVVVYQGLSPDDAATWQKVGTYKIGRPLGPNSWFRAGGDIVIATDIGDIPLSQAVNRDIAALGPSAVSFAIEVSWNEEVEGRRGSEWTQEAWPEQQMVIVALPTVNYREPCMLVANTRTGAWAKFTGWDGKCLATFNGGMFFGSTGGKVVQAYVGGLDQGEPFVCKYVPLFTDFGNSMSRKIAQIARAKIRAPRSTPSLLSVMTDYVIDFPPPPNAGANPTGSFWDLGVWGISTWSAGSVKTMTQTWASVGGYGYALAPALQITSGSTVPLDAEIINIELTYEASDIVT